MKTKIALLLCLVLLVCTVTGQAFADSIMLPESLETIEAEAFYGDTSVTEVILPEGVSAIGDLAFANSGLQRITIPDTVTQIAEDAFDGLSGLTIVSSANAPAREYASLHPQFTWEEQTGIDEGEDLPEIGFYSAETASKETYLSGDYWSYSDQDRTLYLIARNGAVMTQVEGPFVDMAGNNGLSISLSPDGTVATIQVEELFLSQIVLQVNGTHADGEAFENKTYGLSVGNSSPALYWQRAYMNSGEAGGAESLDWSSYPYSYININGYDSMSGPGRFVYGVPENGEITDSMEVVPYSQVVMSGDLTITAVDHGDYVELMASGFGTETLSYNNGRSVTVYNTLPINQYNFMDETFQEYIRQNADTNGDGFLNTGEIGQISSMDISGLGIADLNGIERFTELTSLNCSGNSGISLASISVLPLTELQCSGCGLTSLDVTPFADLDTLYCKDNNDLAELDLSRNTVLGKLKCQDTAITELDLSNNLLLAEAVSSAVPETQTSESGISYTIYQEQDKLLEIGTGVKISGVAPHYDVVPTAVTISGEKEAGTGKVVAYFYEPSMTTRVDLTSEIAGVDYHDYENLEYIWEESYNLIDWNPVDNAFEGAITDLRSCTRVAPGGTSEIIYIRETVNGVKSNIQQVIIEVYGEREIAVFYDSNGGYFEGNNTLYAEHTLSGYIHPLDPEVTREGYTLIGWSTDPNGEAIDEIIASQDITLYAVWAENVPEYTVTYDCNGGEFTVGETVRTETSISPVYKVMTEEPYREGYRFTGWYLNDTRMYGTISATGDMTLTAHWVQRVTLTYDANGGVFGDGQTTSTIIQDIGSTVTLTTYGPTREGSAFSGWGDQSGNPVTQVTLNQNETVYAIWTADCTVTLNADGGRLSNGSETMTVTVPYGSIYTPEQPTRDGYAFTGWTYFSGTVTSVTVTSNISLTAGWERIYEVQPVSVTITADAQRADGEEDSYVVDASYDYSMPYTEDIYVTLSGTVDPASENWNYQWEQSTDCVDWWPAYEGTSNAYTTAYTAGTNTYEYFRLKVNNTYSNVVEIKVYDSNTEMLYKVTLDANGGQFSGGSNLMVLTHYGSEDCYVNGYEPTREGFTFSGWAMNGTLVEDSVSSYEDIVLVAQWSNQ